MLHQDVAAEAPRADLSHNHTLCLTIHEAMMGGGIQVIPGHC